MGGAQLIQFVHKRVKSFYVNAWGKMPELMKKVDNQHDTCYLWLKMFFVCFLRPLTQRDPDCGELGL